MTKHFPIQMSPSSARLLSAVVLFGLTVGYMLQALFPDSGGTVQAAELAFKLAGLAASVFLFLSVYGHNAHAKTCFLDERQRAERNHAYVATHQLLVVFLLAASFYGLFAAPLGWWLPRRADAVDLLFAFSIGTLALPAGILAWRDRAVPDEG